MKRDSKSELCYKKLKSKECREREREREREKIKKRKKMYIHKKYIYTCTWPK